jgi:hypothetical protein
MLDLFQNFVDEENAKNRSPEWPDIESIPFLQILPIPVDPIDFKES